MRTWSFFLPILRYPKTGLGCVELSSSIRNREEDFGKKHLYDASFARTEHIEIIDGGLILSDLSHRMDESLLPFSLRDGLDYAFLFDPEYFRIFCLVDLQHQEVQDRKCSR